MLRKRLRNARSRVTLAPTDTPFVTELFCFRNLLVRLSRPKQIPVDEIASEGGPSSDFERKTKPTASAVGRISNWRVYCELPTERAFEALDGNNGPFAKKL